MDGGTYFFTVVTCDRKPVFIEDASVALLTRCFQDTMIKRPFKLDAVVILPDHLHTLWTLPVGDSDFSTRWMLIKGNFSRHNIGINEGFVSESRFKKSERGIWQRRFWEHSIRDQEDFNRHCDYIHYNPVKHGLVNSTLEWKHSSFTSFVEKGFYPLNWGSQVGNEVKAMNYE